MDPNNPNPYQQPGTPQPNQAPQQPMQPGAQYGQPPVNQYAPQPNMQPTQPVYGQPQPMYGQNSMPSSGSKGKIFAIIGGVVVLIVVVVLAIVLLGHKNNGSTGISSGSTSQDSSIRGSSGALATSKNACQLFTLANAQTVMGSSATGGSDKIPIPTVPNETSSNCGYYNNLGDANSDILTVVVDAPTNGNQSIADNMYAVETDGDANIPGIGDKAAYSSSNQTLYVLKGNVILIVNYTNENGKPILSTDEQVANIMLGNF